MRTGKIHIGTPIFFYEGSFGPSIPLIDPEVNWSIGINQRSKPATLHITTKISGNYGVAKFVYELEERIEIEAEDKALVAEELLKEVANAINRCFDSGYNECIAKSLAFPFPRVHPSFNTEKALNDIRSNLKTG